MARTTLSGSFIKDGSVDTVDLKDNCITYEKFNSTIQLEYRNSTKIQSIEVSSTLPLDNQVLMYDNNISKWKPTTLQEVVINNEDPIWNANKLQSVTISTTTPLTNYTLRYNGAVYEPVIDVVSVNGYTDAVNLTKSDIGLSNVIDSLQLVASNNLSDLTNTSTARTNLNLDVVLNSIQLVASNNLSDLTNTSTARTNLNLDVVLNSIQLVASNNLSDLTSVSTARTNIGKDVNTWNADRLQNTNISTSTPADSDLLVFRTSTSQWTPAPEYNVAQWNADRLQNTAISTTTPTDHQYLKFNNSTSQWEPYHNAAATPPLNPINGQLWFDTNISQLFHYDSTRTKWLSTNISQYHFAISGTNRSNAYLSVAGVIASTAVGFRMLYNGTIRSIFVMGSAATTTAVTIRVTRGASTINLLTFNLSAISYVDTNLNIDILANDLLKVYIGTPTINNPLALIEVNWRY